MSVLKKPNGCDGDQSASGVRGDVVAVVDMKRLPVEVVDDGVAVAAVVNAHIHYYCRCYYYYCKSSHPEKTRLLKR